MPWINQQNNTSGPVWPEPPTGTTEAPSMRMAADAPLLDRQDEDPAPLPIQPPARKRRRTRKKRRQNQTAELTRDAARPEKPDETLQSKVGEKDKPPRGPNDTPLRSPSPEPDRPPRLSEDGGRLRFDTEERVSRPPDRNAVKNRQAQRFTGDTAPRGPTDAPLRPPSPEPDRPSRLSEDGGQLCFDIEETRSQPTDRNVVKKQQGQHFGKAPVPYGPNDTPLRSQSQEDARQPRLSEGDGQFQLFADLDEKESLSLYRETDRIRCGKLRFEDEMAPPQGERLRQAADLGAQTASIVKDAAKPEEAKTADTSAPVTDTGGSGTKTEPLSPREQKRFEKAEKRVEKSGKKLEKAQSKLPTKRRFHFEKEYDKETGTAHRRLRFEKEIIPEGTKPALPKRAGGAIARTAGTMVGMKVHQKLRESERDNTALEAAHKIELLAERSAGRFFRWEKERLRTRPYRRLHRAERRLAMDKAELAWRTALRDNPELRNKKALSKWWQKKRIKRKYAQAAHQAKNTVQQTQNIINAVGQTVRALMQQLFARKSLLAIVALLGLVVLLLSSGLASCTAMLASTQSSYIAASYMANEADITNSNLYYTELEADLQIDIDSTEENYPSYDEYRYNIREISHDPYVLMGYLSAAFDAFRFSDVHDKIEEVFHEQYQLTREEIVETRYDSDGEPYDWYVLQTTLIVRSLNNVVAAKLTPGEQTDRYGVYMQTLGNRQAFDDPFDFSWLGRVSSPYGWRVNGSGSKELHQGIDLAVAQGTPIRAIHDGRVVSAGEVEGYGLCVTILDDKGYQARFAHCASVSVSAGQEVKRGDTIATVGGADTEKGPHLHLEVLLNGDYLDPYYFVDTGGGYSDGSGGGSLPGTPGGPDIPDYPGEAPSDETFAAMLEEAEKYIGFPYVWGGASPSTSFDCSGYVSWVINHSGWNYGRLTAQGLYNVCTPVSAANAKPGDLVFFTKTYSTADPVTHVGIYIGNNQMLHCGNPIGYADLGNSYWQAHMFAFGRLSQ